MCRLEAVKLVTDDYNLGKGVTISPWLLSPYYREDCMDFLKVFEHGQKKHGALNYLDEDGSSCKKHDMIASMSRHAAALYCGDVYDKDSGLHHGLHLMARGYITYTRHQNGIIHPADRR